MPIKKIMCGKSVSEHFSKILKEEITLYTKKGIRQPCLAVILVGSNPASLIYVKNKEFACKKIGITCHIFRFSREVSQKTLLNKIKNLNKNFLVDGILVQLPLPDHIKIIKTFNAIDPKKDVDGFHPYNVGSLCQKNPIIKSCTARGIITLINFYKIKTHGLHAVIVGASNIVGRPISLDLLLHGCTITVTHRFTKNLKHLTKQADLLIVAVGKPELVEKSWIKKDCIVIDVGINKLKNGEIVGDVKFRSVFKKASLITPVPGGVGPMTIISLMQNTVELYKKNIKKFIFLKSSI